MKSHSQPGSILLSAAAGASCTSSSSSSSSSSKTMIVSWALLLAFCASNLWWFLADDDGLVLQQQNSPSNHHHHVHHPMNEEAAVQRATHEWCSMLANRNKSCDLSKGQWIRDFSAPLYTNETCDYIHLNQNCMKNGRPDKDFIYWRWAPIGCELPPFDASLFLQLMKGKKMLFVGDSIARNHEQALLCALSQVEEPGDVSDHQGLEAVWEFPSYDFVLSLAWSPFLVHYTPIKEGPWKIHVDEPDKTWTNLLSNYDVVILSMTNWFFRTSTYYINGHKVVSSYDSANSTSIEFLHGIKLVWETVMRYVVNHYKGLVLVRSTSVAHFEGNPWDKGGICKKTRPYFDLEGKMELPWTANQIFNIQQNELRKALLLKRNASQPMLKLLDVTYNTLLRPDGHPGAYRIQSSSEPRNDCVHWCMPGPIDSWNQLMLSDPDIMCTNNMS